MLRILTSAVALLAAVQVAAAAPGGETLSVRLRQRVSLPVADGKFRIVERVSAWPATETAFIVCDMWDFHHCLNAVRRETELAPRMDRLLKAVRERGVVVIHAPSSCVETYKDHPARRRSIETPRSKNLPEGIGEWCKKIPAEESGKYPIDQSDGGEDDEAGEHQKWAEKLAAMGRNPRAPWKSQTVLIAIDSKDYVSDDGEEIWSVLEHRGIKNVVLMGVHLNMCVLGRPFGLRQMAKNGKNVALMRDMTDTMYNPQKAPFVGHFAGTDLMVEHVEKYVCPTLSSDQIAGGAPFRYKADLRPHAAFLIAEDEYKTDVSLPAFASVHLTKNYFVSFILAPEGSPNELPGIELLNTADVAVVSVRRRVLPKDQLAVVRKFVADGKPVVGLRTASHAFSPRGKGPIGDGRDAWPEFDADVLGGNYHGHHPEGPKFLVGPVSETRSQPILKGVEVDKLVGHGSLYKVSPLAKTATPLLFGSIPSQPGEPIAWINAPATKGRVFYTSLGQIDDFESPAFNRLLVNALDWASDRLAFSRQDASEPPRAR